MRHYFLDKPAYSGFYYWICTNKHGIVNDMHYHVSYLKRMKHLKRGFPIGIMLSIFKALAKQKNF